MACCTCRLRASQGLEEYTPLLVACTPALAVCILSLEECIPSLGEWFPLVGEVESPLVERPSGTGSSTPELPCKILRHTLLGLSSHLFQRHIGRTRLSYQNLSTDEIAIMKTHQWDLAWWWWC